MSVRCPYERKFLIADQPEQLQHTRLLPDIQRRSIQDWHRTISWWRSWRGEKASCRQSTVPLKSRRQTRDSIQIESRISRIETRVAVNLLLSCMTLLSKNDALTTAMKTAEIRPLTISEQSWRQNKWEEQRACHFSLPEPYQFTDSYWLTEMLLNYTTPLPIRGGSCQ